MAPKYWESQLHLVARWGGSVRLVKPHSAGWPAGLWSVLGPVQSAAAKLNDGKSFAALEVSTECLSLGYAKWTSTSFLLILWLGWKNKQLLELTKLISHLNYLLTRILNCMWSSFLLSRPINSYCFTFHTCPWKCRIKKWMTD